MHETSTVTPARHDAHPQDRPDEARRSCDVEVLGAAPDPGGRDLRHARKRRAPARPVGDAVGRCRREVARTCGDARHGVPPRPPRVSTCRRLARGEADLPDARVRDACPRRGPREAGGNGRDRNDIRRWRCRSRERSLGVATGAMSGSHRMPAADRAGSPPETSSREGLGGHRRAKREIGDDSPLLARQAARRAGRDTGLRRAVPRRAGRREVPPALGQGPATRGGRDEATRAVGEPGPCRHRPRREGQVALLAPRPGEARRARDAGGVCGPYPEGLPPGTRHGGEPRGARQGARADGGGSRPEADEDAPGQGGPTTRGQRAMLPAGAVPELAFRIRQGAAGGGCLDLFHVMMSPPDERVGKAACVLDRAMRFPHALRYREYYRKKTSSKGTRSSWEPTTSKGGFIKFLSLLTIWLKQPNST